MDYIKQFLHLDCVIGQGAFGRVLKTTARENQQKPEPHVPKFALKCVNPILKPQRLSNELRHLRDLGGKCNVVQMHSAHFNRGSLFIVMDLIEHSKFVSFVGWLEPDEIKKYIKNLLIALEHVHSHGIMHRDIKPANFLYDKSQKRFSLVDFGLAQTVRAKPNIMKVRNSATPLFQYASPKSIKQPDPTTPTSTNLTRRLLNVQTSDLSDLRRDSIFSTPSQNCKLRPVVNLNTATRINEKPSAFLVNLTASKRKNASDAMHPKSDFNQMLKKLRVSSKDESKEPVRLTVGAYESPVTTNDNCDSKRKPNITHKFSTPLIPSRPSNTNTSLSCDCTGKPKTCGICLSKPDQNAPKSGTPGFKAPEVLLRCPRQTEAIDIWSAGVIFACLLSGHSPFFRDTDDTTSLAEIMTVLGSAEVVRAAHQIGVRLTVEPERKPFGLRNLCKLLRASGQSSKIQCDFDDTAYDLLERMLDPNPLSRITATEALKSPWLDC